MEDVPRIPDGFAKKGSHLDWMSKFIKPGSYVTCVPGQIKGFNSFYISSLEHWNALEEFMTLFHEVYRSEPMNTESIPHQACLVEGLPVAVQFKTPKSDKGWEYHRAMILRVVNGRSRRSRYRVFLVDFGDIIYVKFDGIRYMKIEFLDRFPAQAIECRMLLSSFYDIYKHPPYWEPEIEDEFKKKIKERILGVDFIQPAEEGPYSKFGKKWYVSVSIIKHGAEDLAEVECEHVERSIIEIVRGKYVTGHQDVQSSLSNDENADNMASNLSMEQSIPMIMEPGESNFFDGNFEDEDSVCNANANENNVSDGSLDSVD